MIALFLTISIVLNFVCLFTIVVLFVRQNRLVELETRQKQALQEMEDLLSSFIYEIKDENQQLFSMLSSASTNPPTDRKEETSMSQTQQTEEVKVEQEGVKPSTPKKKVNQTVAKKAYRQTEDLQAQDEELPPRLDLGKEQAVQDTNPMNSEIQDKIVKLYKEGKSIESIAKTLDKGKTEIELTLKFFGIL